MPVHVLETRRGIWRRGMLPGLNRCTCYHESNKKTNQESNKRPNKAPHQPTYKETYEKSNVQSHTKTTRAVRLSLGSNRQFCQQIRLFWIHEMPRWGENEPGAMPNWHRVRREHLQLDILNDMHWLPRLKLGVVSQVMYARLSSIAATPTRGSNTRTTSGPSADSNVWKNI